MDIIIKPIVTEKYSNMNKDGKYGFVVKSNANKVQIKKEIEKEYGVNVESINTMIQPGKLKKRNTKTKYVVGKTSSYKKVIVKLKEGEIIDYYGDI